MRHLTLETLSRLLDESPTPAEAAHLDTCEACAAELEALREQTRELGRLPAVDPPAAAWPRLTHALRSGGLLRESPDDEGVARASRAGHLLRLAASLALFLLGGTAGFVLHDRLPGAPAGPDTRAGADAPAGADAVTGPATAAFAAGSATTVDEAAEALDATESAYLGALERYVELAEDEGTGDPVARLAALEGIVLTTREALRSAPADPLINGYHLTAVAQRDAVLEQLAAVDDGPWF